MVLQRIVKIGSRCCSPLVVAVVVVVYPGLLLAKWVLFFWLFFHSWFHAFHVLSLSPLMYFFYGLDYVHSNLSYGVRLVASPNPPAWHTCDAELVSSSIINRMKSRRRC